MPGPSQPNQKDDHATDARNRRQPIAPVDITNAGEREYPPHGGTRDPGGGRGSAGAGGGTGNIFNRPRSMIQSFLSLDRPEPVEKVAPAWVPTPDGAVQAALIKRIQLQAGEGWFRVNLELTDGDFESFRWSFKDWDHCASVLNQLFPGILLGNEPLESMPPTPDLRAD